MRSRARWLGLCFAALTVLSAPAVDRFPRPEFETGHTQPLTTTPPPRVAGLEAADALVLLGALMLAAWFALRGRSRRGLALLAVFSLLYFGFWRRGCVCSVGSFQNVALALADPAYVLSGSAALFFLLPLAFALFFGRVFCSSVCPLGVVQELTVWKPVQVPAGLDRALRVLPFVYLGWGVLLAVMGIGFPVCQEDPFVAFYRLGGKWPLWLAGGLLLILGFFVARPYCRYACPYGALLSVVSRFARRHLTITPTDCIQCRLCENACPYGAIRRPTPPPAQWPESRPAARARLGRLLLLWPILVVAGLAVGYALRDPLARRHPVTALAERILAEDQGRIKGATLASETFRAKGRSLADLLADARRVRARLALGGALFGGYAGLVLGGFMVGFALRRSRRDYVADRADCVSCGRCFAACPVGRGPAPALSPETGPSPGGASPVGPSPGGQA